MVMKETLALGARLKTISRLYEIRSAPPERRKPVENRYEAPV
jgi:hypothetical protein